MKITYEGGMRFTAEERGHTITVDLPPAKGGTDQGMTSRELFEASLGACIGVYVADYCERVGLNCDGLTVEVTSQRVENPARLGTLHAKVTVPAGIPENRRAAVQKVAQSCLIHATLRNQPEMMIELVS
jgi:uncharacterized OsmC-like protein